MSQAIRTVCILLFVAFIAQPAAPQSNAKVETVLSGLQQRYAGIHTVTANFRQLYHAPGIEMLESGVLWMKKPGLMRWEYSDPEAKLFVADGHEMYLYTPEDRQVVVSRLTERDLRSTPLQFLLGQGNLERDFYSSLEDKLNHTFPDTVMLRLVPRSSERDYDYVVLEVDGKTFAIRRIVIVEKTGNTSEFILGNVETNVKIDNKQFQFKIPRGAEVMKMDEQD
jgi:outer membrane lipoprotein carrier protein